MVPGGSGNRLATLFHCAEFCRKHFQEGSTELQIGFAPNDTDRVAGRVPWYPTSREKRARCGAPDPLLPVQEAGHLIFQLATASRLLLLMTKERLAVPWKVVAEQRLFFAWVGLRPMTAPVSNYFPCSLTLSFVIPERSRGICGSADLSWKCVSKERSAVGLLSKTVPVVP
jgi:hypothetical protein